MSDDDDLSRANEASIAAMDALSRLEPRQIHRRAALVVRCSDCDGRAAAWVVWSLGRPLLITALRDGLGIRYLDESVYGDWCGIRCRRQNHAVPRADLLSETPPPGTKARVMALIH